MGVFMSDLFAYVLAVGAAWFDGYWYLTALPELASFLVPAARIVRITDALDKWFGAESRRRIYVWIAIIGVFFASFSAWDEQYRAAQNKAPSVMQMQLMRVSKELQEYRDREWPELSLETIRTLKTALAKSGRHEFDIFSCSTSDCDDFANGFRAALLGANWFQRPNSVSKLQFKLPQGWVVAGYGDKAGMDALHDAIKAVLHADIATLNMPLPPNTEPYIQFMIGPKPKDLALSRKAND